MSWWASRFHEVAQLHFTSAEAISPLSMARLVSNIAHYSAKRLDRSGTHFMSVLLLLHLAPLSIAAAPAVFLVQMLLLLLLPSRLQLLFLLL